MTESDPGKPNSVLITPSKRSAPSGGGASGGERPRALLPPMELPPVVAKTPEQIAIEAAKQKNDDELQACRTRHDFFISDSWMFT